MSKLFPAKRAARRLAGVLSVRRLSRVAGAAVAAVTTVVLLAAPALAQVSVTPTAAPGLGTKVQNILNWTDQGALWASLASVLVGSMAWGLSKHFNNYGGAHKGQILVFGGATGAVIASLAPTIINTLFA